MTVLTNNIETAIILAAGFGTRLKPLTNTIPKPLLQVGGQKLIDRAINLLISAGIKTIIVNAHYLAEQLIEHTNKYKNNVQVIFEKDILGTGGGIYNAFNEYNLENALIYNSDIIINDTSDIKNLINRWISSKMNSLILLKNKKDINYSIQTADFNIYDQHIIRETNINSHNYVYTGVCILNKKIFQFIKNTHHYTPNKKKIFCLTNILFQSTKVNYKNFKIHALKCNGEYFDTGTFERIKCAEKFLSTHQLI